MGLFRDVQIFGELVLLLNWFGSRDFRLTKSIEEHVAELTKGSTKSLRYVDRRGKGDIRPFPQWAIEPLLRRLTRRIKAEKLVEEVRRAKKTAQQEKDGSKEAAGRAKDNQVKVEALRSAVADLNSKLSAARTALLKANLPINHGPSSYMQFDAYYLMTFREVLWANVNHNPGVNGDTTMVIVLHPNEDISENVQQIIDTGFMAIPSGTKITKMKAIVI